MGLPTGAKAACSFLGAGVLLYGLFSCEALLDVGSLTERRIDAIDAGAVQGDVDIPATSQGNQGGSEAHPGQDSSSDDDDAQPHGEDGPDTEPTLADAGSVPPGDAAPTDASAGPDSSLPADTGPAPIADAADTGISADSSNAPTDSGEALDDSGIVAPASGCDAGYTVLTMSKLDRAVMFDTTGPVCVTYKGDIGGWTAANVSGRKVTVVGSTTQTLTTIPTGNQPGLKAGTDGYIYWNFTAGAESYASLTAFSD
jgi:hypothetical protein